MFWFSFLFTRNLKFTVCVVSTVAARKMVIYNLKKFFISYIRFWIFLTKFWFDLNFILFGLVASLFIDISNMVIGNSFGRIHQQNPKLITCSKSDDFERNKKTQAHNLALNKQCRILLTNSSSMSIHPTALTPLWMHKKRKMISKPPHRSLFDLNEDDSVPSAIPIILMRKKRHSISLPPHHSLFILDEDKSNGIQVFKPLQESDTLSFLQPSFNNRKTLISL